MFTNLRPADTKALSLLLGALYAFCVLTFLSTGQFFSRNQTEVFSQVPTDSQLAQVVSAGIITVANDQELFNALLTVRGGEVIKLKPGRYGVVRLTIPWNKLTVGTFSKAGATPILTAPVTIMSADPSNRAVMEAIFLNRTDKWRIEGISFRPTSKIQAASLSGDDIVFTNNDISFGNGVWTKEEWNSIPGNGISVDGARVEVSYNYLKNINFGIGVGYNSSFAHVHHNKITDWAGDGIRGLGDNGLYEHNYISNPVQVNDNHSDGFQSWSFNPVTKTVGTGLVKNTTLRFNTFIDSTEPNEFRASMQGIGLFDGPYENFMVENNLLVVNHWHGIALYGAINSTIQNNVVLDPNETRPGPAWIKFFPHKNGTLPVGNKILNNINNNPQASTTGVYSEGNVKVAYAEYGTYFVDHINGNYTIKPGAIPFTVGATLDSNLAPMPVVTTKRNLPVATTTPNSVATTTPNPVATTTPVTPTPVTPIATTTVFGTQCAREDAFCQFTGTKQVTYGANGKFFTKSFTNGILCNNANFGDPIVGVVKACTIQLAETLPNPVVEVQVSLTAAKNRGIVGEVVTFTWTSTDADSCKATNFWSGTRDLQGSSQFTLTRPGENKFTLTCTNSTDSTSSSVIVKVTEPVTTPTPTPTPTPITPPVPNSTTTTNATYKIGDKIRVITNVNVRTRGLIDPTTLIGVNRVGSVGTITAGPTYSDDRFGKITWYSVHFNTGFDGFVGSNNYQLVTSAGVINPNAAALQAQIKVLMEQVVALQRLLDALRLAQ